MAQSPLHSQPASAELAEGGAATNIRFVPVLIKGVVHYDSEWLIPGMFLRVCPQTCIASFYLGAPGLEGRDDCEEWTASARIVLGTNRLLEFRRANFYFTLETTVGNGGTNLSLSSPCFGAIHLQIPPRFVISGTNIGWSSHSFQDGAELDDVQQVLLAEERGGLMIWVLLAAVLLLVIGAYALLL